MEQPRAILFDADGVIIRPPKLFSYIYEEEHGLAPGSLQPFFNEEFEAVTAGHGDLKELIRKRNDLWRWPGDPAELLTQWFTAENHVDQALIDLIRRQRAGGRCVYLATNQEKYRAAYLREVMFPGVFDELFISCELGCLKTEQRFFKQVLERLQEAEPTLSPEQVLYFDDRQDALDTAAAAGIATCLYKNPTQIKKVLGV